MLEKMEGLFLRYHTAGEGPAEFIDELKTEIENLTNVIGDWSRTVGGLPPQRHPQHLIKACDDAISQALDEIDKPDYSAAFASLQRAHRALSEIQRAWEANLAYEAALAAHEALEALLPSSRLKQLLTMQNLSLLLVQAASLLQRGKYRQGRLLARACQRRSEMLSERQSEVPEILRVRLKQLSALCNEVAWFLPLARADWADKGALRQLETLLQEQRCALAERLLNDLEVELMPHRTFLEIYRQLRPASTQALAQSPDSDDALRELIAGQSWSAATSHLLHGELEGLSDKLDEVPARATAVQQQIVVYQDPPAAK